jgi:hypothetical protein
MGFFIKRKIIETIIAYTESGSDKNEIVERMPMVSQCLQSGEIFVEVLIGL